MSAAWSSSEMGFAIQPIRTSSGNGCTDWYEWLIRPVDVEADTFIDAVVSMGRCLELDRFVLRQALAWLERQDVGVRLSVNLFASSVSTPSFLDEVVDLFGRHAVSPHQVCLEITEHQEIDNLAAATRFVRLLRRFGIQIALDDIGSGSLHIGLLVPKPQVDYLKLDRRCVAAAARSDGDRRRLQSLVDFGHRMGMELVIEGVEGDEHLALVQELDVAYYQGFVNGLPMLVVQPAQQEEKKVRMAGGGILQIA